MKCEDCRWWIPVEEEMQGECHRYPPTLLGQRGWDRSPETMPTDFCGEYEETPPPNSAAPNS
jgi:hypothetical protein